MSSKPRVSFLDLHNSGLSAIERLCLEEALLRHDPLERSWAIVGMHDPTHHTYLRIPNKEDRPRNNDCIIIMGIGGKPEQLLNVKKVKEDGVLAIKRFSGGVSCTIDRYRKQKFFITNQLCVYLCKGNSGSRPFFTLDNIYWPQATFSTRRTLSS